MLTLALLAAAAVWFAWWMQKQATFPRPPESAWNEAALDAARGERVWLDVDGDRVEAWFLPAAGAAAAPLLIYAHGNYELIDMRADEFDFLRGAGIGVLQVEYPGYGRSEGSPSEKSVTATLVAAYDWAAADARVDRARISGYGRSLGGGAIAQLAARRALAALVLESTFENLGEFAMAQGVPRWLVLNRFDTRSVLREFRGPVLLLHGTNDTLFPVQNARNLAALSPRATLRVSVCDHNDCPAQWDLVRSFLAQNGVCRNPEQETLHEKAKC